MTLTRAVSAAALLAVPWSAWRYVLWFVRHRQTSLNAAAIAGGLLAYSAMVVWSALAAPTLLVVLLVMATAVVIVLGVLARSRVGERWGLPPGALDLLPVAAFEDPDHLARTAARLGPVFKIANTLPTPRLRPTVCVVGLAVGHDLLRDHDASLVAPALPTSRAVPSGFLRNMTSADHELYAPLFRRAAAEMSPPDAASAREELRVLVASLASDSKDGVRPGDLIRTAVRRILIRSIVGLSEPADVAFIVDAIECIEAGARRWKPVEPRRRAFQGAIDHLQERSDDLLPTSLLARALAGRTPDQSIEAIMGNVVQIVALSTTDVSALMEWVIDTLVHHPVQAERLKSDVGAGRTDEAATAFIREVLRLNQSEYIHRKAAETFWFQGHRIPCGWTVRVCVRESHRLASSFDRPDEFDAERFAAALPGRARYSPFGVYRHHCIGGGLTLAIGAIVLEALLLDHTVQLVRDSPPEHNPNHWQPGRRLRIRLVREEGPAGRPFELGEGVDCRGV